MSQLAENIVQFPGLQPAEPNHKEVRVADLDNGYTRIANELLESVMLSGLTQNQLLVVMAVMRKTYGYNKTMDWISNEQMAELTGLPATRCSTVKNQLVRINVLSTKGRSVGLNRVISEWETPINGFCKTFTDSVKKTFTETVKKPLPKLSNTKDTKYKKEKTPLTPQGGNGLTTAEDQKRLDDAHTLLAHYNQAAGARCVSPEPFLKALTATTSRRGYTVDEITTVIDWALATWANRYGKPKPENLLRMTRFDGYLSDALAWSEHRDLPEQLLAAYNEQFADRLPEAESLNPNRIKAMQVLLAELKHPTVAAFEAYMAAFDEQAGAHYFGDNRLGWKADLDFLLKPDTLIKTREGKLLTGGDQ